MNNMIDDRRVIIVDFNPLVHTYLFGGAPPLTCTVTIDNVPTTIDTTIQTHTIKAIHRWSNRGRNPVAVCFDSPCPSRKYYFAKNEVTPDGGVVDYKGGRKSLPSKVFSAINMTALLLNQAGVCVYKLDNYESDDLIYACVQKAKQQYPNLPIDIITNDADMLPLVDDQVSVFLRTKKQPWAESKELIKPHYIQVTPANFQEVVEDMTPYRNILVPYNTLLLAKLLRGDKSDNVPPKADWKPKMYKELITVLEEEAEDLSGLFRYGGEEQLNKICTVLGKYVEDEDLEHIRKIYRGINLNGEFGGTNPRKPAVLTTEIKGYSSLKLQQQVANLNINLPV